MHSKTIFLETKPSLSNSDVGVDSASSGQRLRGRRDQDVTDQQKCVDLVLPKVEHRVAVTGWHMLFGKSPILEAKWIDLGDQQ